MIQAALSQLIAANPGKHYIVERPSGQVYCILDPEGKLWDADAIAGMLSPEPDLEWKVTGDTAICPSHEGHSYRIQSGPDPEQDPPRSLLECLEELEQELGADDVHRVRMPDPGGGVIELDHIIGYIQNHGLPPDKDWNEPHWWREGNRVFTIGRGFEVVERRSLLQALRELRDANPGATHVTQLPDGQTEPLDDVIAGLELKQASDGGPDESHWEIDGLKTYCQGQSSWNYTLVPYALADDAE